MSRIIDLDLVTPDQPWRDVPMPGANTGLSLVPLASISPAMTILCRFPAGFERSTPGGYFGAEEVLVLEGALEVEGQRLGRGDLTFIPSHFLRTTMTSTDGCTVLAWFGGPAIYRSEDELGADAVTEGIRSVRVGGLLGENFLVTSEARWSVGQNEPDTHVDGVDLELTRWWHGSDAARREGLALRRELISHD